MTPAQAREPSVVERAGSLLGALLGLLFVAAATVGPAAFSLQAVSRQLTTILHPFLP